MTNEEKLRPGGSKGTSKRPMKGMSSFFSMMLGTARVFALDAAKGGLPGVSTTALPVTTVIMAFTALEALVNEEVEGVPKGDLRTVAEALRDSRLSLDAKWHLLLHTRCGKTFRTDAEPFDSFSLLQDLRNLLVHRASRMLSMGELPNARTEALRAKYKFTEFEPGVTALWEYRVLNAACARWAFNTAAAMRAEHWRLLGRGGPVASAWEPIP